MTDPADPADPAERAHRVLAGDVRAAARLMRDLDDERPDAALALKALYPHTGRAHVIGVTGNPGAGKSTLADQLVSRFRATGQRVAVLAVDPSSPFSGGAILGDRVRMQRHAGDAGVFIRSLATRGVLGGLSRSTRDLVNVFDAMGFERVILETVGVGQDEVDVVHTAHTVVVVTLPGLGDGVQALKAGLMEIADLFVVNKADRPGADHVVRKLELLLHLEGRERHGWTVPIDSTVATTGEGVDALVSSIDRHRDHLEQTGQWRARLRSRRRAELQDRVFGALNRRARAALDAAGGLDELLDRLVDGDLDPDTAAEGLLEACSPMARAPRKE